jgi:hypothetical protein
MCKKTERLHLMKRWMRDDDGGRRCTSSWESDRDEEERRESLKPLRLGRLRKRKEVVRTARMEGRREKHPRRSLAAGEAEGIDRQMSTSAHVL